MKKIPFNKPAISSNALDYISQCFTHSAFENDHFTKLASRYLTEFTEAKAALLTTSCTAALEISALLLNLQPGDEIIMPSYTFVSTANAFVLHGAKPVFIDIRPDTLNIDENLIEAAITKKTKAIVPMHYAGISCAMESICQIADKYNLTIIEDAAQGIKASVQGRALGSFGQMAALSFHHTKNITSGFGGALLINDEKLLDRAKIIWQKGTNREAFIAGAVDKYTWVDVGSAFLMNEINAALLCSQLEKIDELTQRRLKIWNRYHESFSQLKTAKIHALPTIPFGCQHNAHMYYLILNTPETRNAFIKAMKEKDIDAPFHYIPLHSSPGGMKYGYTPAQSLRWTDHHSSRLVRLPLYADLSEKELDHIIDAAVNFLEK
jgi:dTDP-4-amino-4,6-dideoxygalactose transaminase